jgi:hypothetical protein
MSGGRSWDLLVKRRAVHDLVTRCGWSSLACAKLFEISMLTARRWAAEPFVAPKDKGRLRGYAVRLRDARVSRREIAEYLAVTISEVDRLLYQPLRPSPKARAVESEVA